ncbi:TonB family protein [Helicobacter sp.]|uniref:energy transducer TonB n=1 Tax=Helicobacter sp. TaxID=218 RepID=UPI002A911B3E|nr:TonB family protein [Helicobacter sp.]MDY5557116.1 TonB family protein [Helicobacter sp.]
MKSAIDSHTKYPRQARKIRIQSKVVVGFLWTKQRELRDLKILKSLGHNLLDENRTIQKASRSFPAYTNNMRLQIPIIYQLED